MKQINYMLGYKNINIIQDADMFKFSLDSILLPNFITLNSNCKKVLDIGTGNAPIPLILSTKTSAHIDCVELQEDVYNMGKESIELNKKEEQITIYNADINDWYKDIEADTYDVITCNPPYFKVSESSNINKNDYKSLARHEISLNLQQLLKVCRKLLKNNGTLGLVHRPERLVDIIIEMRNNNIEPKKIQYVYPKKGKDANILLIEGAKNGRPGIKILEPLYIYDDQGNYTSQILDKFEN